MALLESIVKEFMPVFLGAPEGLPDPDIEGQSRFALEYMSAGAKEFKHAYLVAAVSFKIIAVIMKRKPWSRLGVEEKEDVATRLFALRNPLLRSVPLLLATPLLASYYRREEVQVALGFDAKALKADAELRTVTRDRDLPPKSE